MDRRTFLTRVGLGVLGLGALSVASGNLVALSLDSAKPRRGRDNHRPIPRDIAAPELLPPYFQRPDLVRIPLPGGTLHGLPGDGNLVALTVDDGASSEVVGAYAEFCRRSGMRLTFFVTGGFPAWAENAAAIRPLVESGQIQLANHTWTHPDLTTLSAGGIQSELGRTGDFIRDTFGVEDRPYYRPPFGNFNAGVTAAASAMGYTKTVMWYGTLSDAGRITESQVMDFARQWMLAQHIVIGHANHDPVTHVFDQIAELIRDRGLQPVTLDDVFLR